MKNTRKLSHIVWRQCRNWFCLILFAGGVLILGIGLEKKICMDLEEKEPVELLATTNQMNADVSDFTESVGRIKGVEYVSYYKEAEVNLAIGDYSGEYTLCGFEQDYIDKRYKNHIVADMEGTMPYVVLDKRVIEELKTADGKSLKVEEDAEYYLEYVTIENRNARICGVIPESDMDGEACIYTNLTAFENLVPDSDDNMNIENQDEIYYFIRTENGRNLSQITSQLENMGIKVIMSDELLKKMNEREQLCLSERWSLCMGIMLLVCSGIIFYEKLNQWRAHHQAFILWLNNIYGSDVVLHRILCRTCFLFVKKGLLLGVVSFFLFNVI